MAKKEVFMCDYCDKASDEVALETELPYTQGWRYLESFECKVSPGYRHQTIRKHFCSTACMMNFLEQFVHEQEQKVNGRTS